MELGDDTLGMDCLTIEPTVQPSPLTATFLDYYSTVCFGCDNVVTMPLSEKLLFTDKHDASGLFAVLETSTRLHLVNLLCPTCLTLYIVGETCLYSLYDGNKELGTGPGAETSYEKQFKCLMHTVTMIERNHGLNWAMNPSVDKPKRAENKELFRMFMQTHPDDFGGYQDTFKDINNAEVGHPFPVAGDHVDLLRDAGFNVGPGSNLYEFDRAIGARVEQLISHDRQLHSAHLTNDWDFTNISNIYRYTCIHTQNTPATTSMETAIPPGDASTTRIERMDRINRNRAYLKLIAHSNLQKRRGILMRSTSDDLQSLLDVCKNVDTLRHTELEPRELKISSDLMKELEGNQQGSIEIYRTSFLKHKRVLAYIIALELD